MDFETRYRGLLEGLKEIGRRRKAAVQAAEKAEEQGDTRTAQARRREAKQYEDLVQQSHEGIRKLIEERPSNSRRATRGGTKASRG